MRRHGSGRRARAPAARNALLLARYTPPGPSAAEAQEGGGGGGRALRYGDKVRLLAHPLAQGLEADDAGGPRPLTLFSKPIGPAEYAKYSRHQLAGFTWRADTYDSVWQVRGDAAWL